MRKHEVLGIATYSWCIILCSLPAGPASDHQHFPGSHHGAHPHLPAHASQGRHQQTTQSAQSTPPALATLGSCASPLSCLACDGCGKFSAPTVSAILGTLSKFPPKKRELATIVSYASASLPSPPSSSMQPSVRSPSLWSLCSSCSPSAGGTAAPQRIDCRAVRQVQGLGGAPEEHSKLGGRAGKQTQT